VRIGEALEIIVREQFYVNKFRNVATTCGGDPSVGLVSQILETSGRETDNPRVDPMRVVTSLTHG
jgi:hypothetical protein